MSIESIGIICNGEPGEAIAFSLARRNLRVLIYEINRQRADEFISRVRQGIEIKDLNGKKILRPIDPGRMIWIEDFADLKECDCVIEALRTKIETKWDYLRKIEEVVLPNTPIMSEEFIHTPAELSRAMKNKSRFLVAYFMDIEYTGSCVELVVHRSTSPRVLGTVKSFLKKAGFFCSHLQECPGYIHNRLGLLGIQNLFRMYDEQVLSYDNLAKYFIFNRYEPYHMSLSLRQLIRVELYHLLPLFQVLNTHYGERFYLPEFLGQKVTQGNIEEIIRQQSIEYSTAAGQHMPAGQRNDDGGFKHIYVTGIQLIHNNILFSLLRYNKIYFDTPKAPYFSLLARYHAKLNKQVLESAAFIEADPPVKIDLILDFSIQEFIKKIEFVKGLQDRFGADIPILLNTPMYRIEDIAKNTRNPKMIFGIYTQKNYLKNTEIVLTTSMDRGVYPRLKSFLKQVAGDYIETKDSHVRPLSLMIIAKMLESIRILEEGTADMEAIELLGVDRRVFDEIDMFGLDNLMTVSQYLKDHYPAVFNLPKTVAKMVRANKLGYATGVGFLNHSGQ